MSPQDVVNSTLGWIAAGTTIIGALSVFAVYVVGKFRDVQTQLDAHKSIQTAHTVQLSSQQQQLTAVAVATPAPIKPTA